MNLKRLRVGVPANLLALPPHGGHGKVWHRVLAELRRSARVIDIDPVHGKPRRVLTREPQVVLADGHADLPASLGAPLVVQVHEAAWFEPELRALLDPTFFAHIAPRTEMAVRAATRVITGSEAARRDLLAAYELEPERVCAVPLGVDATFRPTARGGRALVAGARRGAGAPYVLYAAMLHPRKNLAVVRQAMSDLAAEGFPHVLVVAGGPATDRQDSSDLERAATAELPGAPDRLVRIKQPTDQELAGLMAEADAFCLPSLYEGFGLTVLEAMACGAPVVVSDRGALPEVVANAGLVVPPTTESVREALRSLLSTPARGREVGVAAAARALAFTWDRTAAGWLSVLREAAAERDRI